MAPPPMLDCMAPPPICMPPPPICMPPPPMLDCMPAGAAWPHGPHGAGAGAGAGGSGGHGCAGRATTLYTGTSFVTYVTVGSQRVRTCVSYTILVRLSMTVLDFWIGTWYCSVRNLVSGTVTVYGILT